MNFRRLSLLAWLLLAPLTALAVSASRFTHISLEQGLSQSSVQAIVQDHEGYLWFGTEEGLNRYDGYAFVVFRHNSGDPRSLRDNLISALFVDSKARLWVGTQSGLCRYDPVTESFQSIANVRDRIDAITEGPDGTLWLASQGGGLFLLTPGSSTFASYLPDPSYPDRSLVGYSLSTLYCDHRGRLWLGTNDRGFDQFVPGTPFGHFVHHRHDPKDPASLASDNVWGISEDAKGRLLIATYGKGLDIFDEATGKYAHVQTANHRLSNDALTTVYTDPDHRTWIGTDGGGLLRFDPKTDTAHSAATVSEGNDFARVVRSLYQDRQGHLWIGTFQEGLYQLKPVRQGFTFHGARASEPAELSDAPVASILQDHAARVWVGTEHGMIDQFDAENGLVGRHFRIGRDSHPAVLSLYEDQAGGHWAGTYGRGLLRFDPNTGATAAFTRESGAGLANDEVWAMCDGPNGTIWLGTNGGLDRFDPKAGKVIAHFAPGPQDSQGELSIRALTLTPDGILWIGSIGGLAALRRDAAAVERHPIPTTEGTSKSASVISMHLGADGSLWLGTLGSGLVRFDPNTGVSASYRDFPSNVINAIEEQPKGILWFSTDHGLVQFNAARGAFTAYDLTNGLQSIQFHLGAGGRLRDGRLLFGSVNGLYAFDPSLIAPDAFAPPVVITQTRVIGAADNGPRALPALGRLTLQPSDRLLTVDFAALDFNFPKQNRYAYLLEGETKDWVQLDTQHEVTLTNLPPGHYRFRIKATNSDGIWSEASTAALALDVQPPYWATWWFRGAVFLVLAAAIWAAHRSRIRGLQRALRLRKESEVVLRKAEEKYRELVEDLGEVIFSTDPAGRITYISPVIGDLTGVPAADLLGDYLDAVLGALSFQEIVTTAEGPGHPNTVALERQLPTRSGEEKSVRVSIRVLREQGQLAGFRGVIVDTTELKKLEAQVRQSQKMDAVGQLAGGIAHDFNNLLTAIMGYTELLLNDQLAESARKSGLREIHNASHRAATLTKQLLAFSRQQVLDPQVLDLNQLLMEMEQLLQRLIGEQVLLALYLDPEPTVVRADPGQMQQIVLNLAINARDAMPQGGRLLIETKRQQSLQGVPEILLAVSDTGTGMTPEVKARLFEPFFTTKGVGKGTGLGLSTVYGIVRQSSGRIDVTSTPGKGSTFRVILPQAHEALKPVATPAVPDVPPAPPPGIGTLLVVEDNESVAGVLRRVLAEAAKEVIFATNADDALRQCEHRSDPVDLLITDVIMPGRSGKELADELHKRYPALRVIFMSGYADDMLDDQEQPGGRHHFLQKPFTHEELFKEMEFALRRK